MRGKEDACRIGIAGMLIVMVMFRAGPHLTASEQVIPGRSVDVPKIRAMRAAARGAVTVPEKRAAVALIREQLRDGSMYVSHEAVSLLEEIATPEARSCLRELAEKDMNHHVKGMAIWSLWKIKLRETSTRDEQVALLKNALHGRHGDIPPGDVRNWAVDELAERGAIESLPEMKSAISDMYGSSQYAERRIQDLTLKTEILAGSNTRLEAYRKALQVPNRRISEWAISRLGQLEDQKDQAIALLMSQLEIAERKKNVVLYHNVLSSLKGLGRDLEREGRVNRELFNALKD